MDPTGRDGREVPRDLPGRGVNVALIVAGVGALVAGTALYPVCTTASPYSGVCLDHGYQFLGFCVGAAGLSSFVLGMVRAFTVPPPRHR